MHWLWWLIVGAVFSFLLTFYLCEVLARQLQGTRWQFNQPCGPAEGIAVLWLAPASGALVWVCFPPTYAPVTCAILTTVPCLLWTAFASVGASD